jgi:hypothetical protein
MDAPKPGRYADEEWQKEHSDVVHCPECGSPVEFRDWEDDRPPNLPPSDILQPGEMLITEAARSPLRRSHRKGCTNT